MESWIFAAHWELLLPSCTEVKRDEQAMQEFISATKCRRLFIPLYFDDVGYGYGRNVSALWDICEKGLARMGNMSRHEEPIALPIQV